MYIYSRTAHDEWLLEATMILDDRHREAGLSIDISVDQSVVSVGDFGEN